MCALSRFSCVQLFVALWTVARQTPLFMTLQARILEWIASPPPRDLPDPGVEPASESLALTGGSFITEPRGKP